MSLKSASASICLFVGLCISPVRAEIPPDALEAYDQQRWEDAIALLQAGQRDAQGDRLLALAYFRSQDVDAALPAIRNALEAAPGDTELNQALLEILIADRLYDEAEAVNETLASSCLEAEARY